MRNKKKWLFYNRYVIIQIEGVYPERLVSLLEAEGVPLEDLRRAESGALVCVMTARTFRRLHRLNRRCRCRIRILRKGGGRHWLSQLWRRRVLIGGMALTLAFSLWASHRVWFVEVRGCERMDEAVLRHALREQGLYPGQNLRRLPLSDLGDYVAARYEELAFLELHVDGIFLRVRAREAMAEGERMELSQPCDLVSTREGIVTKITTYGGRAQVKVGDRVKRGAAADCGSRHRPGRKHDLFYPRLWGGAGRGSL